jgi:hypothetical protein
VPTDEALTMKEFEKIVALPQWAVVENRFQATKAITFMESIWQKVAS